MVPGKLDHGRINIDRNGNQTDADQNWNGLYSSAPPKKRKRWRKVVGRCIALPLFVLVSPIICLVGLIDYLCGGLDSAD